MRDVIFRGKGMEIFWVMAIYLLVGFYRTVNFEFFFYFEIKKDLDYGAFIILGSGTLGVF